MVSRGFIFLLDYQQWTKSNTPRRSAGSLSLNPVRLRPARDYGVDLSLTVCNLRLTPHERVKRLDDFQHEMRLLRKAVLSSKQNGRNRSGSEAFQ